MKSKLMTLTLVVDEKRLLLGMKKRGFGEGRCNGFGGKVAENESIEKAAERELNEEVGLVAETLEQVGLLNFSFESDTDLSLQVHVFKVKIFSGEPVETEEMKPKWFTYFDIPFEEMWPDDIFWLPLVLSGKRVSGSFHFDAPASLTHMATILSHDVHEVSGF